MTHESLHISGVDAALLEQQRKDLNSALDSINAFGELTLNTAQVEALTGVLNMLDAWSDERAGAGIPPAGSERNRLAIVLEGGIVQGIVADRPGELAAVVIDYDEKDAANPDVMRVIQSDGADARAWVYDATPQQAMIDLDALYREVYGHE